MTRDAKHAGKRLEGTLRIYICEAKHAFFCAHTQCPVCGRPLTQVTHSNEAVLTSQTVVRVTPTGRPFRLGIAKVACGAKTLCLVDLALPRDDYTPVALELRDDLYHAIPR